MKKAGFPAPRERGPKNRLFGRDEKEKLSGDGEGIAFANFAFVDQAGPETLKAAFVALPDLVLFAL